MLKPVAPRVLFVALINEKLKYWRVFVDSVKGKNHENEFKSVIDYGKCVAEYLAKFLFKDILVYLNGMEYRQ